MFLESMDLDHMEEKFDEDLKDQRKTNIIGTNQTLGLEKALVNLMNQHVMKIFIDHDHIISQSLVYRLNKFVTSKQNSIDLMIQHRTKEVYSVDNIMSSKFRTIIRTTQCHVHRVLKLVGFNYSPLCCQYEL